MNAIVVEGLRLGLQTLEAQKERDSAGITSPAAPVPSQKMPWLTGTVASTPQGAKAKGRASREEGCWGSCAAAQHLAVAELARWAGGGRRVDGSGWV